MLILVLSPLFVIIATLLGIHFKGNPIYAQERIGWEGKTFRLLKFRSFKTIDNFESISKLGRFIRSTSIDELPQFFNVLSGQMSFVGPRPLLVEYLDYYNEREKKRHLVKPGITGLAQVRLGNSNDWEKRMEMDVTYVARQSFILDVKILLETVLVFLNFNRKSIQDIEIEKFSDFASRR